MPKTYPSDAKTDFILCESIRQENNNKLSLLGYAAGYDIGLSPLPTGSSQNSTPAVTIAIAFVLRDGEGSFDGKIEIVGPNGAQLGFADVTPIQKNLGDPNVVFINIPALPIQSPGTYSFVLSLDATIRITRNINVRT